MKGCNQNETSFRSIWVKRDISVAPVKDLRAGIFYFILKIVIVVPLDSDTILLYREAYLWMDFGAMHFKGTTMVQNHFVALFSNAVKLLSTNRHEWKRL